MAVQAMNVPESNRRQRAFKAMGTTLFTNPQTEDSTRKWYPQPQRQPGSDTVKDAPAMGRGTRMHSSIHGNAIRMLNLPQRDLPDTAPAM